MMRAVPPRLRIHRIFVEQYAKVQSFFPILDVLDDSDDRQVRDGCEVVKLESKGSLIQVVTETGQ